LLGVGLGPPLLLVPLISGGEYHQSDNKDDDNGDECDLVHRSSMCLVMNSAMLMATSPKRIRSISSAVSIVQIYNIILRPPNKVYSSSSNSISSSFSNFSDARSSRVISCTNASRSREIYS